MVRQNISAGVGAIKENIAVIRAKFHHLLEQAEYFEDVEHLLDVIPRMLENVEAMADQLESAYEILSNAPKREVK